MAELAEVRDGLKTRLATITGLRAHDVWPDQVNTPAAMVRPISDPIQETLSGIQSWRFEIVLIGYPAQQGMARGQETLDGYLAASGSQSVAAALRESLVRLDEARRRSGEMETALAAAKKPLTPKELVKQKKLFAEGLFDSERKRPLPLLPERIVVITSPTGAAVRDVLSVLKRRFAGVRVLLMPCLVQGASAAGEPGVAQTRSTPEAFATDWT